jgi:outer membrane receptor protein involved in Fe transport
MKLYHGGWWLALQVDASVAERIEILKGPAAVLYGNTPPGGLVNVVSKRPSSDAATLFGFSIGNNDSRELSLDSTGAIGNSDLSYRFVGLARERDGQAVTTREERYVPAPSVRWDFTDATALTLTGFYQDDPETGRYGAASPFGSLAPNPNGRLPTDFYDGDVNFESGDRRQRALGYTFEHSFSDDWSVIQNLRLMDRRRRPLHRRVVRCERSQSLRQRQSVRRSRAVVHADRPGRFLYDSDREHFAAVHADREQRRRQAARDLVLPGPRHGLVLVRGRTHGRSDRPGAVLI